MSVSASIKNVEMASNGLTLKQSIIGLLTDLISDSSFIANDFLGYIVGDFLSKEDLEVKYEDLKDSIDYTLAVTTENSIYHSISRISGVKDGIRNAINKTTQYTETSLLKYFLYS